MITAGIDIGSVTTKVIILGQEKVLARAVCPTGAYPQRAAQEVLERALGETTLSKADLRCIVSLPVTEGGGGVLILATG